jgi:hypothetical protein
MRSPARSPRAEGERAKRSEPKGAPPDDREATERSFVATREEGGRKAPGGERAKQSEPKGAPPDDRGATERSFVATREEGGPKAPGGVRAKRSERD